MRAGIVGYGLAGRYFHASTLVSAGFDVAAICTRSLEKKAIAHQDFPGAILVNSIDELVVKISILLSLHPPMMFTLSMLKLL